MFDVFSVIKITEGSNAHAFIISSEIECGASTPIKMIFLGAVFHTSTIDFPTLSLSGRLEDVTF